MPQTNVVTVSITPIDPFIYDNGRGVTVTGYQRALVLVPGREPQEIDLNPTNGKWTWQQIKEFLHARDIE